MGEEQVPKRSVQVLSGSVPERSVSHRDPQAPGRPDLRDVRRDFAQFAVGVGRCEPFESLEVSQDSTPHGSRIMDCDWRVARR